jgi:dicarboxylate transporter 10
MQNDSKAPKEQRRNYKHAIDGLIRIWREEGPKKLFNGRKNTKKMFFFISFILIKVHQWLLLEERL